MTNFKALLLLPQRKLKKKKKDQFFVICLLRLLSAHVATLSLCLKSIYPSSFSPPPPPFTSFIIGFIDPETCPIQFRQWGTLNTHKEEIRARKLMGLSDSLSEKERPRERVCVWTYVWGISQGCCEKPSHGCKQLNTHTYARTDTRTTNTPVPYDIIMGDRPIWQTRGDRL